LPYAKRWFASASWKVRLIYRLLGFRNATRLAMAARAIRRSRYFRWLSLRKASRSSLTPWTGC
jgi:hypothetical protein